MTPSISVLLPTRGRADGLLAAVTTLLDLAARPEDIELLIRTDNDQAPALDDTRLEEVIKRPSRPLYMTEFRGPRHGYGGMHHYYNELAKESTGQLLFIWNDDTEMMTQGWDDLLLAEADRPLVQFIHRDENKETDDTFPVVDRRIYNALGHLANHCYVDTWLGRVARAANVALFRRDVVFHHHRFPDLLMKEQGDALRGGEHARWFTLDAERAADVAKIREMLDAEVTR